MIWPERPTIHTGDPMVRGYVVAWSQLPPSPRWPQGESFRRCTWCGAIHPGDLIEAIQGGAYLKGASWKYGWPHKFYVWDIPNPQAAEPCTIGVDSWYDPERQKRVDRPIMGVQGLYTAKWYNEHLGDQGYDQEAFDLLLATLSTHSGITWGINPQGVYFEAPFFGYTK